MSVRARNMLVTSFFSETSDMTSLKLHYLPTLFDAIDSGVNQCKIICSISATVKIPLTGYMSETVQDGH